uniref:Uncharacterized protein n=1 Tax=Caenorhabditis japonica TaxID=281687 RepID=A0A8R1E5W0_CAEJA
MKPKSGLYSKQLASQPKIERLTVFFLPIQESSYYQEDGSQYYNEYYGATEQTEYHATFADPAAKSGTDASAYPAPSK